MSSSTEQQVTRRAKKAGSWYDADPQKLDQKLTNWLEKAGKPEFGPARAIISPHAGYEHCGSCAAFAYKEIAPDVARIFILGPSHHVRLEGIALSPATTYETPLGDLTIDTDVYEELHSTGLFREMDIEVDENEHSLELQLPYIKKVMSNRTKPFSIVPMMVGSIDSEKAKSYGRVLSRYFSSPENTFVISSDFCHWGKRFNYQHYEKSWGEIYQSIEHLDKLGMKAIKDLEPSSFSSYLKTYGNTICGRNPINVLLATVQHLQGQTAADRYMIKFLNYLQSSHCHTMHDSSVSYVAASVKEFSSDQPVEQIQDIVDI